MAKREISSTLKNLKFMQRAAKKLEPKPKEDDEEEITRLNGSFAGALAAPRRKCVVIMEGNPHPGALKGRMSFQCFNPSIDKLHEEAAEIHQMQECGDHQNTRYSDRENVTGTRPLSSNVAGLENVLEADLKRKQPEVEMETPLLVQKPPENTHGDVGGQSSLEKKRKAFHKQQNREKLDWNVLRPPKPQHRVEVHNSFGQGLL